MPPSALRGGTARYLLSLCLLGAVLISFGLNGCSAPTTGSSTSSQVSATPTSTPTPQPGCSVTSTAATVENCVLPNGETVTAPNVTGYRIDQTQVAATGAIVYVNDQTGKVDFAFDAHATFTDATSQVHQGMAFLTQDGIAGLHPVGGSTWTLIPGVGLTSANPNQSLSYSFGFGTVENGGSTNFQVLRVQGGRFVAADNHPNAFANGEPTAGKMTALNNKAPDGSYLDTLITWNFPWAAYQVANAYTDSGPNAGLETVITGGQIGDTGVWKNPYYNTFGSPILNNVSPASTNYAYFDYRPGSSYTVEPASVTDTQRHMVQIPGTSVYIGGFLLTS